MIWMQPLGFQAALHEKSDNSVVEITTGAQEHLKKPVNHWTWIIAASTIAT